MFKLFLLEGTELIKTLFLGKVTGANLNLGSQFDHRIIVVDSCNKWQFFNFLVLWRAEAVLKIASRGVGALRHIDMLAFV